MHLACAIAAQKHGFLAHARDKIIPRLRDLALVTDKQPDSGEEPLQLLPVDLVIDKDFAANLACSHIHETAAVSFLAWRHHRPPSASSYRRRPVSRAAVGPGLRRDDRNSPTFAITQPPRLGRAGASSLIRPSSRP